MTSWKKPKDGKGKGKGKKGDENNPTDRSKPKAGTGSGPNGTGRPPRNRKKCNFQGTQTMRLGPAKNTLRKQSCVNQSTKKVDWVVTSLQYAPNPTRLPIVEHCDAAHGQACYHYSSVIRNNRAWQTLTCPPEAAATSWEMPRRAPRLWTDQHDGDGWQDEQYRQEEFCDRDEYPPLYLLGPNDPAYVNSGRDTSGQMIRFVPWKQNQDAGKIWKSVCFNPIFKDKLSDTQFENRFRNANMVGPRQKNGNTQYYAQIQADHRPEFSFGTWGHDASGRDDGLWENPCWPNMLAPEDPGYAIFTFDQWYGGRAPPYNYRAAAPIPP
jgi:hypothetical protein